jgi:hypothetical protein
MLIISLIMIWYCIGFYCFWKDWTSKFDDIDLHTLILIFIIAVSGPFALFEINPIIWKRDERKSHYN